MPFGEEEELTLTLAHVEKFLEAKTRSGASATLEDKVSFLMLCKHRLLNPWVGDAYLLGYDSKDGPSYSLITAYQALAKRAEMHPQYDGMEAGCLVKTRDGELAERSGAFILDDDTLIGAWARVYRKDRARPYEVRIKRSAFDKRRSRWTVDPEGMLLKCAKAAALRECFPVATSGLYIREEMEDEHGKPTKVATSATAALLEGEVAERKVVAERDKVQAAEQPKEETEDDGPTDAMLDCEHMLRDCETGEQIDQVEKMFSDQLLSTAEKLSISTMIERKRKEATSANGV